MWFLLIRRIIKPLTYLLLFHQSLNLNTKQYCFFSYFDLKFLSPFGRFCVSEDRKMKIQCDVCEKAPATLICCADEAALCAKCDIEVHAANKLASKHQRLFLDSLSTKFPPCDICLVRQVSSSVFFICSDLFESIFYYSSREYQ